MRVKRESSTANRDFKFRKPEGDRPFIWLPAFFSWIAAFFRTFIGVQRVVVYTEMSFSLLYDTGCFQGNR
jgi:hypothetical protein